MMTRRPARDEVKNSKEKKKTEGWMDADDVFFFLSERFPFPSFYAFGRQYTIIY